MQADSSLGCMPHTVMAKYVICTTREKPWGEGQLHLHVLTPEQAKQNSVDEASKGFSAFRGKKALKVIPSVP